MQNRTGVHCDQKDVRPASFDVPSCDEIKSLVMSLREFECWPHGVDIALEKPKTVMAASSLEAATKFVRRCLDGGASDHGLVCDIHVRAAGVHEQPDLFRVAVEVKPTFHTTQLSG